MVGEGTSSLPQPISQPQSTRSTRVDPGWKYCHPLTEGDTNKLVCNFCKKVTNGGITRAKQHLMGKKGNVAACKKCPPDVREVLWKYLEQKKIEDNIATSRAKDPFESEDEVDMTVTQNVRGNKGPMDLFCRNPEAAIAKRKKEKLRQTSINETCDKRLTANVHQSIARFWYQVGLSFNLIKLKSFEEMVTAIGSYGPNLRIPSYHEIRVPLLNKELEFTEELLKDHKEQWRKHGYSIMSDAWTDRKFRSIINFLVNSAAGTMFLKSVDASDVVKSGDLLFEMLDSIVEEVGEENVVQVISDNGSNYVSAGKKLEEKSPHLFWTPCAAHCIDLMLEDIGKLSVIKKTTQRGISLVGFIYGHTSTLSLMRQFTNKRELVRHAVTRFATSYLSLERLHQEKTNLRKMFTSEEWTKNKLCKEVKGKQATKVFLMPSFWKHVVFTLKVMVPLVRVLRLADGERKPAMGYIYEAIDRAKETITNSFSDPDKYKDVFAIIDKRWQCQLGRDLHVAAHLLNPEFFYSNSKLENDLKVNNGLYNCITRLVRSEEMQTKILMELPYYKSADGLFGSKFAVNGRKTLAPAQWWKMYGMGAPHLQQLAIKILSLTCSASGCERNWSVFEQIHTKKRNRLEHKKLHDLVYIKYNQQLKQRYNLRDEIDPIALNDIDTCNEWLVGEMDDPNEDAGNDLVFDDDPNLKWQTVYEASGAKELRTYTRSKARKIKEPSSVVRVTAAITSTSKRQRVAKGKRIVVEVEEAETLEHEESSEESDASVEYVEEGDEEEGDDEDGEEEEGYAPIDDGIENDYVGVEEED